MLWSMSEEGQESTSAPASPCFSCQRWRELDAVSLAQKSEPEVPEKVTFTWSILNGGRLEPPGCGELESCRSRDRTILDDI